MTRTGGWPLKVFILLGLPCVDKRLVALGPCHTHCCRRGSQKTGSASPDCGWNAGLWVPGKGRGSSRKTGGQWVERKQTRSLDTLGKPEKLPCNPIWEERAGDSEVRRLPSACRCSLISKQRALGTFGFFKPLHCNTQK